MKIYLKYVYFELLYESGTTFVIQFWHNYNNNNKYLCVYNKNVLNYKSKAARLKYIVKKS